MTSVAIAVPLALQAIAMGVDEFHFHRERGLSRWERVGHPLDTLFVLACYAVTLLTSPSSGPRHLYFVLATASCILITKDEPLHAVHCGPWEHWLHSVLFVLHPIVLGCAYWFWRNHAWQWLLLEAVLTSLLGAYQCIYWNTTWLRANPK